jgi:fructokinase
MNADAGTDGARAHPAIFGEVLFDCFPDGSRVLGGAPFNVAWHLQAFGEAPLFVSRVGDDEPGRRILAAMDRWGMNSSGLQTDPEHLTGEVHVSLQDGEPSYDIVNDRAFDHIDRAALPNASISLVYHGSLALRSKRSARALDGLLETTGAPVFIDVNLRSPWWSYETLEARLTQARWAKLNHDELKLLAGGNGDTEALALRLIERHALATVIVTLGEQGAMLMTNDAQTVHSPELVSTTVVDTVGAGDAFSSVCILGLLHHWPPETLLTRAQAFACHVVTQRGATSEDRQPYARLLKDWTQEPGRGQ